MRGNELLDKMELIDPAYIEAADAQPNKKRAVWVRWGAMAACLCLAAVAALTLPVRQNLPISPDITTTAIGETEIAAEPYSPGTNNGPNNQQILGNKPTVSSYGEATLPVDMSVTNGGVHYSSSLESAMANYGESANYRVFIELFSNGVQISGGSAPAVSESQRLSDLGYIVAIETYTESEIQGELAVATATYYFTLHATYDQLTNFPASDTLGYSIMLYDEYFDSNLCFDDEIYNGSCSDADTSAPTDGYGIAPFDEDFTGPPCYDPDSDGSNN